MMTKGVMLVVEDRWVDETAQGRVGGVRWKDDGGLAEEQIKKGKGFKWEVNSVSELDLAIKRQFLI